MTPRLLTYAQVAETLGVSKRTVERLVASRGLKSVRVTERVTRVSESDLARFVSTRPSAAS